ncbi:MAG TPA: FAD-dependent oxidoreductase [Fimbriimonadaceae bacterium]|nr:FAD-dependent oxidoreductase [Fimbriimonadaceae bacterium]
MSPDRYDVAVIGGGPAGSFCAARLAQAGARVALCHRAGARRSTVELLSGRARWMMREVAMPAGVEVFETMSLWGGTEPAVRDSIFDPYGPALAVERAELDAALREFARSCGVTLVDARIRSVCRRDRRWIVEDGLVADWIVLATGGAPKPALGREEEIVHRQTAFFARCASSATPRLRIERAEHGWWYGMPVPSGGLFLGLCSGKEVRLDEALAETRMMAGLVEGPLSARWGMPASIRCYSQAVGEGWIAVGNAAFSPDPLSGEGVWFALNTAQAAGDVLLGQSTPAQYQARIDAAAQTHVASRRIVLAG